MGVEFLCGFGNIDRTVVQSVLQPPQRYMWGALCSKNSKILYVRSCRRMCVGRAGCITAPRSVRQEYATRPPSVAFLAYSRPQLAGPLGSVHCRSVVVRACVLCENVTHSVIHRFRCRCSSGLSKRSSTRSVENERSVVMVQLSLLHVSISSCTRGHNAGPLCLSAPYSYQFQDPPLIPSSLLGPPRSRSLHVPIWRRRPPW